ncbi:MAG TPA: penicillin acylase family protein, partial [Microthrixaceae bacterium]|nr:penicillin acylase family protein [Microthrixaceae bacterium]
GIAGWCKDQPWVQEITAEQLYGYIRSIPLNASSTALAGFIGKAQPPGATPPAAQAAPASLGLPDPTELASNAWAIGTERSESGNGMLLANPHFPWEGALRFWETHLTVPGELDVYGAHLTGVPGVGVGFTKGVAWAHTVSAGRRFTAYKLSLAPGMPTSYLYDGAPREMTSREATIEVLGADGAVTPMTRTLWASHYGPILEFPGVGWSDTMTITYRDANLDDDEILDQYFAMDRAQSLDDLKAAHERHNGVPLFNTIAVGAEGTAWYADTSATPNLSDEALAAYEVALETDSLVQTAAANNAVLLDGSTSRDEWVDAEGARDPGLVPYEELPQVERDDYVFNANDSFWMPHATELLEGDYSPMHGRQDTMRSWRTRENAWVLDDTTAEGPSGDDGAFSLDELAAAALRNEAGSARELRAVTVQACRANPTAEAGGETIDLVAACDVLAQWDGRHDTTSVGAVLWREFWTNQVNAPYAVEFVPADPLATPNGFADPPAVAAKLARAVQILQQAGVAIDTPLGAVQHDGRLPEGSERIGLGGGLGAEGLTNVIGWSNSSTTLEDRPKRPAVVAQGSSLTPDGYWVNNGSSFIMAMEFTDDGPRARTMLTYGQVQDRTSPLFTSQMQRFADKDWKDAAFTAEDIEANLEGEAREVTGKR